MRTMQAYLVPGIAPLVDPDEDVDSLTFEWHPLGLNDLVSEIPIPKVLFPTCFGVRYRTRDYTEERAVEAMRAVVPESILPANETSCLQTLGAMVCHTGMKIGGMPFYYFPNTTMRSEQFLCGFGGVSLMFDCPFPLTNEPEPIKLKASIHDENFLIFRDGCRINMFLQDDGEVAWEASFS